MRNLLISAALLGLLIAVAGSRAAEEPRRLSEAGKASGPQLFVASTGSDSASCTRSSPCASFDRAYHVAKSGEIVEVAAGTYPPQTLLGDASKGPPNVVIRAAKGADVNIVAPPNQYALSLGRNSDDASARSPSFVTLAGIHYVGGVRQFSGSSRSPLQARSITLRDSSFTDVRSRLGPLITFTYVDDLKMLNNDIGPVCCGTDGLNLANAGAAGTDPANVLIDHNYVHDVTQDCSTNPDPACTNEFKCPSNTRVCDHPDGSQFFGVRTLTMSNNRYYNAGTQNIFLQSANGGVFSNLTFVNNMVSTTAGPGVTNSVSLSGPGVGLFSGYIRFLNNSFQRGVVIYDSAPRNRVIAPDTQIAVIGNILGYVGNDNGAARCSFIDANDAPIQPLYSHNLIGNRTCASTDRRGQATFISTDPLRPDLHLQRGSAGIGKGDKRRQTITDIDGEPRPRFSAPDIGADQREPAQVLEGKRLGAVRLGEAESEVIDFLGTPRSLKTLKGSRLQAARYRLHGGSVWVVYEGRVVVGVGTTSSYYEFRTIRVGTRPSSQRFFRAARFSDCRSAFRLGAGANRIYLELRGSRRNGRLMSIWLLGQRAPECGVRVG